MSGELVQLSDNDRGIIILDILMDKESLSSIIEDLETFIELKQQQFLIMAWIQIKKSMKAGCLTMRTSVHRAQNRTNPNPNLTISYNNGYFRNQGLSESSVSESQKGFKAQERLATDYANMRGCSEEMFQTFNPGSSRYQLRKQLNQDQYRSYSKNLPSFKDCDLEDDQEFEDIVLDRLSKLEENINQMMREKRLKEDLRGYVGAPIAQSKFKQDFQPESPHNHQNNLMLGEDSSSQKSLRYQVNRPYQSWQTSPIKNKNHRTHVHNLKYIPIQKNHSPVNISKIKNILQQSHQDEDESILDNVQYFPSKQVKQRKQPYLYSDTRSKEGRQPQYPKQPINALDETSSRKDISSLYFNRYGASQTARNSNQVHFFPKNIEMKTVIESKGRYVRTGNGNNVAARGTERQPEARFNFKPRKSGASDSSANSYLSMPSWRVNLSALY